MLVTLKKLSIYDRMSEETTCFVADVYVDGKKVAIAQNDGRGGNTHVDFLHEVPRERRDEIAKALKSEIPAEYASFTSGIEWAVDKLVDAAAQEKEDKRVAKAVAREDAKAKAECAKCGISCARFATPEPGGRTTRWTYFKKGGEEGAKMEATKKYLAIEDWTVIA